MFGIALVLVLATKYGKIEHMLLQVTTESYITSFVQTEVIQAVRSICQCDFQMNYISEVVLLCDEQNPNQAVYRARITSYGDYTAEQLVHIIEDWITQGPMTTSDGNTIVFDPNCPIRISTNSDPICEQAIIIIASITPSSSLVSPSSTAPVVAIVAVLVTSFIAIMILVLVILTCIFVYRKQHYR